MDIAYFLNKDTLEICDVAQIQDYQINLDEETNAKTEINFVKKIEAQDGDVIFLKGENDFLGVIEAPTVEENTYKINAKYITNLFDRKIILKNSNLIQENGIEDFIKYTIENEFIDSSDTFLNIDYIDVKALTHTPKQFSVSTENGIYNFHTFMTNCTQNYNINYDFKIKNGRLKIAIKNIENKTPILIDTTVSDITNYQETFSTTVTAKVTVLCKDSSEHNYYLLNNRTVTENKADANRAIGNIETIYEEETENAHQAALNAFKSNSYSHLIQFDINKNSKLYDVTNWRIGDLVKIKNKESKIINTYISAISIKKGNSMYSIKTGNIRTTFIDKLKQKEEK